MADLEYLGMNKFKKFCYRTKNSFVEFPYKISNFFKTIPHKLKNSFKKVGSSLSEFADALIYGDWKTRLSFVFFGFGNIVHKQYLRGFLFLLYEIVFAFYMIGFGGQYISKFSTLGTVATVTLDNGFKKVGDNSFNILLYGVLTIFIIFCTIIVWISSVRQAYNSQRMTEINKKLSYGRDDLKNLGNKYYHTTLLSLPFVGLVIFTIVPLIFMIFVAFTNYNNLHLPPEKLFTWVGFSNFSTLISGNGLSGGDSEKFAYTFRIVLLWTIVWAVLATFSNYFIGMVVAIIINKKGIKFKKFWRTCLVTTIAVPQFVSLLLMSKMLATDGIYNVIITKLGGNAVRWLLDPSIAKCTVLLVNLWVGVPYTVLSCTGILMNIPDDLYEAARIDGANPYKMFTRITLPYMNFVMGPSLISAFVGNINNFNIIYLLTGGGPSYDVNMVATAGQTDLLITWLYKLTVNDQSYDMASVIGIFVFIIVALASLLTYSKIGSVKNEEDFQ